ncbi:hypothetical protein R0K04_20635, partial [Pseudoalteromonas sp. SIMBA_153]
LVSKGLLLASVRHAVHNPLASRAFAAQLRGSGDRRKHRINFRILIILNIPVTSVFSTDGTRIVYL